MGKEMDKKTIICLVIRRLVYRLQFYAFQPMRYLQGKFVHS